MHANYPDERSRGIEPVSRRLMERAEKQYEEMRRREAEYARLEEEAFRRMSGVDAKMQHKEEKP